MIHCYSRRVVDIQQQHHVNNEVIPKCVFWHTDDHHEEPGAEAQTQVGMSSQRISLRPLLNATTEWRGGHSIIWYHGMKECRELGSICQSQLPIQCSSDSATKWPEISDYLGQKTIAFSLQFSTTFFGWKMLSGLSYYKLHWSTYSF